MIFTGTGCTCTCSRIVSKIGIIFHTEYGIGTVVNLRIGTEAAAELPGIIIFQCLTLFHVTNTSITCQLNVAYAVFQIGNANTEIVEFIGEFISQTVDECPLFSVCTIFMSHSLCYDFSGFITGNVTFALEVNAVNTLNDTGISQFYYGIVCPAVGRYVYKRIGGKCRCAYCHGCY